MNSIDTGFYALANEIETLQEQEIYHRIRTAFERVPAQTRKNCADFFNKFGFWGRLEPEKGIYEQIAGKAKTLYDHMHDFIWLYEKLEDYRSKKTLYAILNNWYRYDFDTTAQTREYLFDEYFDLDLIHCTDREVFVDLGAYTGDTVLSYLANYGADCYQKIYCYEITPKTYARLVETLRGFPRIECRQKGVGAQAGKMFLSHAAGGASANMLCGESDAGEAIEVTTLDEDICEPITLIKADVEGFEQQVILGAQRHIANDRPRLLFSVYHNNEDLWKIQRMLDEIGDNYRFYLRFKSSPLYPTEITLFAI